MDKALLVGAAVATAFAVAAATILAPGVGPAERATPAAVAPSYAEAVRFEDPAGDARDGPAGGWVAFASCLTSIVVDRCAPAPAHPAAPSAPRYDVVAYAFEGETADEIAFSLAVQDLQDPAEAARPTDGMHRIAWYGVCWSATEDEDCTHVASVRIMAHDGVAATEGILEIWSDGCNEWSWCAYGIPVEVVPGAPATVHLRVPKAHASGDGSPLAIHGLHAFSGWYETPVAFPMWHGGVTVHTPARHIHDHSAVVGTWNAPDWTERADVALALAPPAGAAPAAAGAPLLAGGAGMTHADGSKYATPAYDLVGFDLYEEDGVLVHEFALAELAEAPEGEFDYSVAVGLAGDVWEVGYRGESGKAYGYAGRCVMEECQDATIAVVDAVVVTGAPGLIQVRVPMDLLGSPAPGTATTLVWVLTMSGEGSAYFGEYDSAVYGDVHSVFMVDMAIGGTPYVVGSGHRGSGYELAHAH